MFPDFTNKLDQNKSVDRIRIACQILVWQLFIYLVYYWLLFSLLSHARILHLGSGLRVLSLLKLFSCTFFIDCIGNSCLSAGRDGSVCDEVSLPRHGSLYHSNPDLMSMCYDPMHISDYPEHVLKVYKSDQTCKYLLVHKVNHTNSWF